MQVKPILNYRISELQQNKLALIYKQGTKGPRTPPLTWFSSHITGHSFSVSFANSSLSPQSFIVRFPRAQSVDLALSLSLLYPLVTSHSPMTSFLLNYWFGTIVYSHAVLRNNIQIPCTRCPVSPNDNILQNYSTIS